MHNSRFPTQSLRDAAKVCEQGQLDPPVYPDPEPVSRNFERSSVDYASLLAAQMDELDALEMEVAA
jgi:hypothetical protein